jgi:AAA family ATP:ADP antiporter
MQSIRQHFSAVARHEWPALIWSFAYFFFLLSGYYMLRPLRDALAAEAGAKNLSSMFGATFVIMLAIVPIFGWLTSRFPRRRWLPACIAFFVLNLLGFYCAWRWHFSLDVVAVIFFVWLTVYVMFVVSVFWSFMADLFTVEQAKRLYGFIAAGGTVGALVGSKLTALLAERIGSSNLMLLAAVLLALTLICIWRLLAWQRDGRENLVASAAAMPEAAPEAKVGGGVLAGIRDVAKSRYLQGICLYVFLYTVLTTVLYVQQADLLKREYPNIDARTALLGDLAFIINLIALALQMFAFKPLANRFGVTALLAGVPLLSMVGFAALAWLPTLTVLMTFGVLRSAAEYALAKPARETLFNPLSREEKYKAKNLIDTTVYRGGDWASAAGLNVLRSIAAFPAIAVVAALLSALWAATGWWLGRQNEQRSRSAAMLAPATQAR